MSVATLADPKATAPAPAPPVPAEADPFFRISLGLYNRMIELGLLGPGDPIELLDGFLVKKMPKGSRHVLATLNTYDALKAVVPAGYHPRSESPIGLPMGPDGDSAPEPDIALIRGEKGRYKDRHPGPGDILLIVEIADTSLASDRRGLRRFGWAGIPTVWIVNLRNETVEVYSGPSGPVAEPGYAGKVTSGLDDALEIVLDDGAIVGLRVADIFA